MGEPGPRDFARITKQLDEMQAAIREAGVDGWLLYDLHARNAVTARIVGMGDMTRRFFVLIPAQGEPVTVIHGIEEAPWARWPWQRRKYVGWRELRNVLTGILGGMRSVAMEISEQDAVPALDLVPYGVVELGRAAGPAVVGSGDLVTRFYSRWSADDLASHRRASAVLTQVAQAALVRLARAVDRGDAVTELAARGGVIEDLTARGAGIGADCIFARGVNAADPHYDPVGAGDTFRRGDVVLLDLWSKESEESVYADQTWMGCIDTAVPGRASEVFGAVRDARDAAVHFLEDSWAAGKRVEGGQVDDVARAVIRERGFGEYFIHRTGHSIDQSTHGMGPNIDNFETNETRLLIPGVGFSIEPGIYLPGEIGVRSEINVYVSETGPEVTTLDPQHSITALLGA